MKRLLMMFSSLSISPRPLLLHAPSSLLGGRKRRASLKPFSAVARYGSNDTTNNEDDDEKFLSLLERIKLSLRIESRNQFSNVEGKQMPFSAFARAYFPKIVADVEEEKERAVLEGFARYETLTRKEREMVVKEAGILVERLVREKMKKKEKIRANDAATTAAVESAASSVVSSPSVHAAAGLRFLLSLKVLRSLVRLLLRAVLVLVLVDRYYRRNERLENCSSWTRRSGNTRSKKTPAGGKSWKK